MAYGKSVAIVGISGLFPGAATLAEYWQGILAKKHQSRQPPAGRWLLPADQVHNPRVGTPDCVYSDRACFLDADSDSAEIPGLDLDPDWLARLDPMFRLLLRVGQQTMADAGDVSFDRSRAGVIIGNLALPGDQSSALSRQLLGRAFAEQLTTTPLSLDQTAVAPMNQYVAGMPAALLARALKFSGTCFTLDAACASSLYAVKLAVDELLSGRADAMLAGGLSRPDSLYTQMGFSQLRALSPTGICAPFARSGNGLVVGEGCGLLLLKRTRDAVRDGDRIYAVIRGIGLSNDQQGNLLAPASEGQLRAMRAAYRQAGWQPTDVDLIECHATGTPVGDAVEFASLRSLWPESGWRPGQCVIGSVKGNIGHLLTAAGAAALIKTLLALQHNTLPPLANFDEAAPGIDLETSPFRILQQPRPWEPRSQQVPRRAAVSAFGFGGINAHLLLEEWLPAAANRKKVTLHPTFSQKPQPIAVVGMAAHFGPWDDTDQLLRRIGGGDAAVTPQRPQHWWGAQDSAWLRQRFGGNLPRGHFVPAVTATAGEFRIPPTEQAEMLPRQLLMLKVAAAALADAGATAEDHLFSGVFIGCGLDLQATNFSFRWGLAERATVWAQELGLELDNAELSAWIATLRDAAGPPLTANRTMGALGSIVASRIAKEFSVGGPSFTISSEENSALRALETGIHLLQEGSINRAIVGAVDLAGDLRAAVCRQQITPFSPDGECRPLDPATNGLLIGEGAGALVLKRLEDARQDGDRIHAVISGIGTAVGGAPSSFHPTTAAYAQAMQQACAGLSGDIGRIDYIETDGSGDSYRDGLEAAALNDFFAAQQTSASCWIGSVKGDIGHAGGAAGMAGMIKTILCLKQRLLPPIRRMQQLAPAWNAGKQHFQVPEAPQYWLNNRSKGPRRALVNGSGYDGTCSSVLLEEYPGDLPLNGVRRPLGKLGCGLFVFEGASRAQISAKIALLEERLQDPAATAIDDLAQRWYRQSPAAPGAELCLAIVAADSMELAGHLRCAADLLRHHDSVDFTANLPVAQRDRVFFTSTALGRSGRIAFVFPGSGNHFAAMGRDLSALWPEIYAAQEQASGRLADQYLPTLFWNGALPESIHDNHNALVISHVAVCTALHDLLRRFGLRPQLISGYSLGESAGLFSSGAWQERDAMVQRLTDSPLFTRELAGECRAARRVWGLPPAAAVDWLLGIVNRSADQVKRALAGKKRVYLLIINSYREVVIGGQRCEVEAVVKDLDCHFIPLRGVTTVHCEVTRAVADAYRNLHLFRVTPPRGIDFYSCALARKYPLTSANAADAILAQALDTIDYPQVVEQLYADGARIFLEVGPGSSCSRMIGSILADRPHLARSFCNPGQDATLQLLRLLAHCLAERVAVDLAPLYSSAEPPAAVSSDRRRIHTSIGGTGFAATLPEQRAKAATQASGQRGNGQEARPEPLADPPAVPRSSSGLAEGTPPPGAGDASGFQAALSASADAHAAYLSLATTLEQSISRTIARQFALLRQGAAFAPAAGQEQGRGALAPPPVAPAAKATPPSTAVVFDRSMCLEFAVGSVAAMLGAAFAEVDSFPTRVRLPDEPLMLVDRIVA
ncbi:MAG: beta-ketoacyl synthase N-terminal-like domain-containing protein, partial [Pelovirga sp.]